jgi:hypothetical protein
MRSCRNKQCKKSLEAIFLTGWDLLDVDIYAVAIKSEAFIIIIIIIINIIIIITITIIIIICFYFSSFLLQFLAFKLLKSMNNTQ